MFWRHTEALGPLGCNCTIVADLSTREAIVVDPGGSPERLLQHLAERDLTCRAIVHTHAHIDHVYATAELAEATGATAYLHASDRPLYEALDLQAAMLGIPAPRKDAMVGDLKDEQTMHVGHYEVGILHTPGHSPGSVSFHVLTQRFCLTGDTLFHNGVGRTDLWGGDAVHLRRSIESRLLGLPDDTLIVAGHGQESTIGQEKRTWPQWAHRLT